MSVKAPTLPHCVWSLPPKGALIGLRQFSPWGGPAAKTNMPALLSVTR